MGYVDAVQAGKILGLDPSAVRKYANRGILTAQKSGKKMMLDDREVADLKAARESCSNLGITVKEIFVLHKEGATGKFLAKHYGLPDGSLEKTLAWYAWEREMHAETGYGEDMLLTGEVAARLKLSSKPPVYSLVAAGRLQSYPFNGTSLISLQSLVSYLGDRVKEPLYTSREALELLRKSGINGITIANIDTVALSEKIGIKIQEKRMSTYSFTLDDIGQLRKNL